VIDIAEARRRNMHIPDRKPTDPDGTRLLEYIDIPDKRMPNRKERRAQKRQQMKNQRRRK
jgi:hypothetical protein